MMSRKIETKYIGQYLTSVSQQTGVAPFSPGQWENAVQQLGRVSYAGSYAQLWRTALPKICQAGITVGGAVLPVSDHVRIGDSISPSAHHVKMTVRFAQELVGETYGAQDNPLDLTVYIFYGYIKSLKTYEGATSFAGSSECITASTEASKAMTDLLDDGDGTQSTFDGDPIVAQQPLSQFVNMKVKKVHLRRGGGYVNTNAGNGGASPNYDAMNTLSKQLTLKFKPPKTLKYPESADVYPNNYAPVYAVGYLFNDATASRNNAAPEYPSGQVEYVAQSQLWYKDA